MAPISAAWRPDPSGDAAFRILGLEKTYGEGSIDAEIRGGLRGDETVVLFPGETVSEGVRLVRRPA